MRTRHRTSFPRELSLQGCCQQEVFPFAVVTGHERLGGTTAVPWLPSTSLLFRYGTYVGFSEASTSCKVHALMLPLSEFLGEAACSVEHRGGE